MLEVPLVEVFVSSKIDLQPKSVVFTDPKGPLGLGPKWDQSIVFDCEVLVVGVAATYVNEMG